MSRMKKSGSILNKTGLAIVLLLSILDASSQNLKSFSGHCGLYYNTLEQLDRQLSAQVTFYDFKPGQVIASIGAQCANWEAAFAVKTDSVCFYLEDIDSSSLNNVQAAFAWNYYSSLRKIPITCDYKIIIGTENSTNLPLHFFDKILIINSFHEFGSQVEMLHDIASKLKAGGLLYIDETLAKKNGELHTQCRKKLFTDSEMIELLGKNGFFYVNGLNMDFRKTRPQRKIFVFRKTNI